MCFATLTRNYQPSGTAAIILLEPTHSTFALALLSGVLFWFPLCSLAEPVSPPNMHTDQLQVTAISPMKHLDNSDGVIGAVPTEERPPSGILGDNIELLILHLRMPDAETWIAHTATRAVLQLEEQQMQDYLLISNGLLHRTPCTLTFREERVDWLDSLLLDQLFRENIGFTDSSTVYIATAQVQHSYTELIHYITRFSAGRFISVS